jgi:hypothetical protein
MPLLHGLSGGKLVVCARCAAQHEQYTPCTEAEIILSARRAAWKQLLPNTGNFDWLCPKCAADMVADVFRRQMNPRDPYGNPRN